MYLQKFRWCFTTGTVLIVLALMLTVWTPRQMILYTRLELRPIGLTPLKAWESPQQTLLKLYIFNVTNAEGFTNGTEKLHVQEVGPLIFSQKITHTDVIFHPNGTVSFTILKGIPVFESNGSSHLLNETLVVPNWALLSAASNSLEKSALYRLMIHTVYNGIIPEMFLRVTLEDFLWNYEDPFVAFLDTLAPVMGEKGYGGILGKFFSKSKSTVSVLMGHENGHAKFFTIDTINGTRKVPNFDSECKDSLDGATLAGALYPQYLDIDRQIHSFQQEVCKIIPLRYEDKTSFDGISAYKFVLPNITFHRARERLQRDCYEGTPALRDGFVDASKCYNDAPIVVSLPHFLYSDINADRYVTGLNPSTKDHQGYVIIEPYSGTPLDSKLKFQFNLHVRNLEKFDGLLRSFSESILPIFWMEAHQTGALGNNTWPLYATVSVLPVVQTLINVALGVAGVFLIYVFAKQRSQQTLQKAKPRETEIFLTTFK